MRTRLVLFGTITAVTVIVAFLVPLLVLVRNLAEDRALASARLEAQNVAVVAADDEANVQAVVSALNATGPNTVTVFPDSGAPIGAPATAGTSVELARTGRAFTVSTPAGVDVLLPVEGPSGQSVVQVSVPQAVLTDGVRTASLSLLAVGVVLVLCAGGVAWLVARQLSRPVTDAAEVAEQLAAGMLAARVVPSGPPEVAELGRSLNQLGTRIGDLVAAERELMADLSHRLRTPITALRLDVDAVADEDQARQLGDRVDDLARAVDEVVRSARVPRAVPSSTCDANTVVRARSAFWAVLAEDQERALTLTLPDEPSWARVDSDELAAAVDVLIENVFTHTPDGVAFAVEVVTTAGGVHVMVGDAGPGLVATDVTERGASSSGSTGLGLDIARRCVESVGGSFEIGRSPLGGAQVQLRLPRAGAQGHARTSMTGLERQDRP